MDCLILAGGKPNEFDPLYQYSQGDPKALIDVAGSPMITWILRAMIDAQSIESIAVIGISALPGYGRLVEFLPDEGSLIDNVIKGRQWANENGTGIGPLMICSSDIPLITGEIVDKICGLCTSNEFAVYYPVVPRESIEARFPNVNRTVVRLSNLEAASSDLIVVHQQAFDSDLEDWRTITSARKHPWRIARFIGLRTLVKFITRRLSLEQATKKGEELVGHPVKVLITDMAEICMDVDKPEHLDLVVSELGLTNVRP